MVERHILGLTPTEWGAVASIVNVALVFVLVLVNIRYMRSAARQADASHEQASAAREQASVALEGINLTSAQLREQFLLRLTEILIDFRRLNLRLDFLRNKVRNSWGMGMTPLDNLLPVTWPTMVRIVETQAPSRIEDLRKIERLLTNAEFLINEQMAKPANNRDPEVMKAAANDLDEAATPLKGILTMLENRAKGD
jgi:hypothetical protein